MASGPLAPDSVAMYSRTESPVKASPEGRALKAAQANKSAMISKALFYVPVSISEDIIEYMRCFCCQEVRGVACKMLSGGNSKHAFVLI